MIHCKSFSLFLFLQGDVLRNILVIDNLEEKLFVPVDTGHLLNMCHFRMVVKSVAKFHAVSLTYKKTLFETFLSQSAAAKATRKADEVDMGEHKVATGRIGLFARFPFLKVISAQQPICLFTSIFQPCNEGLSLFSSWTKAEAN